MRNPPLRSLALRAVRRTLAISVFLYAFYIVAPFLWEIPPLTTTDVVAILVIVFFGVWVGIGFSFFSPLPSEKGLPRAIRTALLAIPTLGIGIFIQLLVAGPDADRAFYVMFALAAWLGSGFVKEEPADE